MQRSRRDRAFSVMLPQSTSCRSSRRLASSMAARCAACAAWCNSINSNTGSTAAAVATVVGIAAATAPPAATERQRRRFVSIGVFVGGVLCTQSAWVIGFHSPLWLGLEPGRKFALPLGLLLWYHGLWQRQVWYQRKRGLRRQAKGFKAASGGTPPSLPQLMLGSQRRATKPLTAPTRSGA
jgi:hypothetical protein